MTAVNPHGGSGDPGRDGWCTPEWLTDLIGPVDLDPCSNARSTVQARVKLDGTGDLDGLALGKVYGRDWNRTVFVNPPYSRGQVGRWATEYSGCDFIFLLRWDPSTEWFRYLIDRTGGVWFPHRRINFVPPPGARESSNPFPHALFFRGPVPERFRAHGTCLTPERP